MVASSFDAALARVLRHEGGYSNHPADPGGPTNKGVIQRVYDAYRTARGLPKRSVRELEVSEMRDIYRRQYWDAVRADELPAGLDYAVFDAAVNSGPAQAAKWLQRALGVAADGQVGAVTLQAAAGADLEVVIEGLCDLRLAMLKGLRTWPVFGRGWAARVADVRRDAVAMAKGGLPPAQSIPADRMAKGAPEDRSLSTIAKSPEGLAAGVSTIGAMINAAENPGPMQWAIAVAVLIVVAVGAWFFIRRQRAAA